MSRKSNAISIAESKFINEWAEDLNAPITTDQIRVTSTKRVWWRCIRGHTWPCSPTCRNRFDTGCPRCVRSEVFIEHSIIAQFPEIAQEWSPKNDRPASLVAPNSCIKFQWICKKCTYEWQATPTNRTYHQSGCPRCNGKVVTKERSVASASFANEWHPTKNGSLRAEDVFLNSNAKRWWICPFGHEYQATPQNRFGNKKKSLNNIGCSFCASRKLDDKNNLGALFPHLINEFDNEQNEKSIFEYPPHSDAKIWWICKSNHSWSASISGRTGRNRGCPYCSNKLINETNNLAVLNPKLALEYSSINEKSAFEIAQFSNKKVRWTCQLAGHNWEAAVCDRSRKNKPSGCPYCAISHTNLEKFFENLMGVEKYGKKALVNYRYLPDFKLSDVIYVNVDGLYPHSQGHHDPRPISYHRKLFKAFEKEGKRILQFYEDEVYTKSHIVKSIINSVLGKNDIRLHGRKLTLTDVNHKIANAFLAKNHLIGSVPASRHVGLYDNDTLISLVSFRCHKEDIELTRLCIMGGVVVRGGATRLIKEISRRYSHLPIRTLIDNRYASVKNWENWGFIKVAERLGYQYTDFKIRKDKRDFRVEAGVKEEVAAKARGFYKIYDAGKATLVMPAGFLL